MGYLLLILYIAFTIYALSFNGKNAIKYLIILCFFQNFILVIAARFLNESFYTLIVMIKEVYVLVYLSLFIISKKRIDKNSAFCIIAVLILICHFLLFGNGEIKGQLTSFRQLYLPFIFYLFGKSCKITKDDFEDIGLFYIRCCIITVLFGFVEMFLGTKIWDVLGLTQYAAIKGNSYSLSYGLYKSFYTYDFLGMRLRRMASFLVDPVILGQLLSYGVLLSLFIKNMYRTQKSRICGIIIIGVGLLCSLAKGGIVIATASTCILLGKVANKKILSRFLTATAIVIFILFAYHAIADELSGSSHINGLVTGFQSMLEHPLGTGIGTGGNMSDAYSGFGYQAVAGDESYIGSLMAQTGLIGVLLNVLFWKMFLGSGGMTTTGKYITIMKVANVSLLLTSFINYTAISFSSCFIFIILAATSDYIAQDERMQEGELV